MAAGPGLQPCTFAGTQENYFFFHVGGDETDLQIDSFHKSTTSSVYWLRNKDNLFLYLAVGDNLIFEDLTGQERGRPDCKFIVQAFKDSDNSQHPENGGIPVTLSAVVDNTYKVVSCGETFEIKVKTMESIPETIEDDCCTLFYMRNTSNTRDHYLFQSAFHKNHVLGFQQVPGDDAINKLALRPWQWDEVDDGCIMDVALCQ